MNEHLDPTSENFSKEEVDIERALRPLSFDDFAGQEKVLENLSVFVQAANMRNDALDPYICTMKTVKIIHPQFGLLLEDSYQDAVQFKLFLNLVHSCLELNQDLTTFNGRDFLLHIPYTLLVLET